MSDRFSRQSFLGHDSEAIFRVLRVGVVGLGGGGSHVAQQLAHLGVQRYALFDPDHIELSNLNRTVGATLADALARSPKVIVAERTIRALSPEADIWSIQDQWQTDFASLRACDVVFGCVDGFAQRSQLEETCRRHLIPLIDIGMDVHEADSFSISGQIIASIPGKPCLRCMSFIRESDLEEEGRRYGAAGSRPQVVWVNGVLASTAVGLFVQMFTPWCAPNPAVAFVGYDGDKHLLEHDARLSVTVGRACSHFAAIADLGDPLWSARASARGKEDDGHSAAGADSNDALRSKTRRQEDHDT